MHDLVQLLMQVVLTWLWQGTALAVGVWGLLRLLRANAATRFALWWAALLALFALLLMPSLLPYQALSPSPPLSTSAQSTSLLPLTLPAVPPTVLAMGIGVWLGLALLGLVHVSVGVSHLHRVKRACRPFPLARERRLPHWLAARDEGRRVRLCLSKDVCSASALGLGLGSAAAIVAINPSLLVDVDDDELDHIILYEYAHIQRWDDWLHVLQLALQSVLVMHPAVSGIGRALRLEREIACDDWVIHRTQMATTYAGCLTKIADIELATPNDLIAAMGASGRRNDLTRRIERLLAPRRSVRTRLAALPVASVAVLLIAATVGLWQLPPLVATEGPSVERADGDIVDFAARSAPVASVVTPVESLIDPVAMAAAIVVNRERLEVRGRSDLSERLDSNARRVAAIHRSEVALPSADSLREAARDGGIPHAPDAAEPANAPSAVAASASPIAARTLDTTMSTMSPIAAPLPSSGLGPELGSGLGLGTASNAGVTANAGATAEASDAETGLTDAVPTKNRRALQRAAGVGAKVGQGAVNVGVTVGQGVATVGTTVGEGAKRVGTATGGFLTHVATSIGKALP